MRVAGFIVALRAAPWHLVMNIAADLPQPPDSLKDRATTVEVLEQGETRAAATYVDAKTVEQAIRRAGPIH